MNRLLPHRDRRLSRDISTVDGTIEDRAITVYTIYVNRLCILAITIVALRARKIMANDRAKRSSAEDSIRGVRECPRGQKTHTTLKIVKKTGKNSLVCFFLRVFVRNLYYKYRICSKDGVWVVYPV